MNNTSSINLSLILEKTLIPIFYQLLSKGFIIYAETGCTIKDLLCGQLGIKDDYLEERIQTIFLDNKTVDDVDSSVIRKVSILSLSAAMPGVLGATLRKGGRYAPMRSQISHDKNIPASQLKKGKITLKLWNLIVKELGPNFLQQGIWIKAEEAGSFMVRHREELLKVCTSAKMDGKSIALDQLQDITSKSDPVFFQVNCDKNGS